ncbi:MAG: hypothetical protein IPL35_12140 [Sphingobacteriales bacterium]|nr:hypothetical protein [Sphingobacteriales bacterium]
MANLTTINSTTITGAVNWTNLNRFVNGTITVNNGAILTITNCNFYFANATSGIVVNAGGTLIVDGSDFTRKACENWKGITVKGNTIVPHPNNLNANSLQGTHPHHGIVWIRNTSTISEAQIAIQDMHQNTGTLGSAYYFPATIKKRGGGIVWAQNSTFENNANDIVLLPFEAAYNFGTGEDRQLSALTTCGFISSKAYFSNPSYEYLHISLTNPGKVDVSANIFTCSDSNFSLAKRGTAIKMTNTDTDILNNDFQNLFHGIDVYNIGSASRYATLQGNSMSQMYKGITLHTAPATRLIGNSVSIHRGTAEIPSYAALAISSASLQIDDNTFESTAGIYWPTQPSHGLVLQNCYTGDDARFGRGNIRNNGFSGCFAAATQIDGDNSINQFNCNAYGNHPHYDWYLVLLTATSETDYSMNKGIVIIKHLTFSF